MAETLETKIVAVLRGAGRALRATDIVRQLSEEGVSATKAEVNRALYGGPFELAGRGPPPSWVPKRPADAREGHFTFQVDGVGLFHLREGLAVEGARALLEAALSLVAPEAAVVRVDASEGGRAVARLAEGRATVEALAP